MAALLPGRNPLMMSLLGMRSGKGIALVVVLWMVAALSLMVVGISASVRDEARVAALVRDQAQASAAGEAAIFLTLQQILVQKEALQGTVSAEVVFDGQQIRVEVASLNGLIDINRAPLELLTRMFGTASPAAAVRAGDLAQAVIDFRQQRGPQGQRRSFEAPEDLLQVPGVDYTLYAIIAPLVTTDAISGALVDPASAPEGVLRVLAQGNQQLVDTLMSQRERGGDVDYSGLLDGFAARAGITSGGRLRLRARVALQDGREVEVVRHVQLRRGMRSGPPWNIFYAQQRVQE